MDPLPIKRAIVSVTDKSGLDALAAFLHAHGVELVSTGGTQKFLENLGLPVTPVHLVTGFPEMLDGRVKTLHPHIHAGILADKDNPGHLKTLADYSLKAFDAVIVNLYDFKKAAQAKLAPKDAIEQIDIGGPTMLRAAAKNYHGVLVVPEPAAYATVQAELAANDFAAPLELRRQMAARTFALTSAYDAMIAEYLK
ncbi:MAG: IMP cyclohydrolase [Desulfovibrionaceae bacterium]|nr:IMP cyclohydrolase [Desulfovibrionaceae bacterium]MBF0513025.1 IMP cyclohydrolase [Desulfovibrionaceae bacterium]